MNEKPEALRLANAFETHAVIPPGFPKVAAIPCVVSRTELSQAAAELRRLHAENERMREALTYDWDQLEACRASLREHMVEIKRLRELLTEAKDLAWSFGADSLLDRINEVLQEET